MKTMIAFGLFFSLSIPAFATEYALMVSSCDKVEGDTSTSTYIGSYNGFLPEKAGVEKISYQNEEVEITGEIHMYEGGQRRVMAQAKVGTFEPVKLMVRVFNDSRAVASAGFCETKEDEGKLSFTFVTFPKEN